MEIILGVIIVALALALVFVIMRSGKGAEEAGVIAEELKRQSLAREADRAANAAAQTALTSAFQQQVAHLTQQLDARLDQSARGVNDAMRHQFGESQKLISEINAAMENRMSL